MPASTNWSEIKKIIETEPLWYANPQIIELTNLWDKQKLTKQERSDKNNFKKTLKTSKFVYAETGYNWDQWRKPIDCLVIHHTSSAPTISLRELNIVGLRLYMQQFLKDEDVIGKPLYSGHYWFGKPKTKENMTFVSYHYLVRPSGKIIQLVDDSDYLWHAGNLGVNQKSIGIALAGKFTDSEPTPEALKSVAKIINDHGFSKDKVFGHNEVIKKEILGETECPGSLFVSKWKPKLLELL